MESNKNPFQFGDSNSSDLTTTNNFGVVDVGQNQQQQTNPSNQQQQQYANIVVGSPDNSIQSQSQRSSIDQQPRITPSNNVVDLLSGDFDSLTKHIADSSKPNSSTTPSVQFPEQSPQSQSQPQLNQLNQQQNVSHISSFTNVDENNNSSGMMKEQPLPSNPFANNNINNSVTIPPVVMSSNSVLELFGSPTTNNNTNNNLNTNNVISPPNLSKQDSGGKLLSNNITNNLNTNNVISPPMLSKQDSGSKLTSPTGGKLMSSQYDIDIPQTPNSTSNVFDGNHPDNVISPLLSPIVSPPTSHVSSPLNKPIQPTQEMMNFPLALEVTPTSSLPPKAAGVQQHHIRVQSVGDKPIVVDKSSNQQSQSQQQPQLQPQQPSISPEVLQKQINAASEFNLPQELIATPSTTPLPQQQQQQQSTNQSVAPVQPQVVAHHVILNQQSNLTIAPTPIHANISPIAKLSVLEEARSHTKSPSLVSFFLESNSPSRSHSHQQFHSIAAPTPSNNQNEKERSNSPAPSHENQILTPTPTHPTQSTISVPSQTTTNSNNTTTTTTTTTTAPVPPVTSNTSVDQSSVSSENQSQSTNSQSTESQQQQATNIESSSPQPAAPSSNLPPPPTGSHAPSLTTSMKSRSAPTLIQPQSQLPPGVVGISQASLLKAKEKLSEIQTRLDAVDVSFLSFGDCELNDDEWEVLQKLLLGYTHLETLDLHHNEISSISLDLCTRMRHLRWLQLSENQIKTLPSSIDKLALLDTLDLSENQLEVLPPEIGNLKRLCFLRLDNNKLRTLPPELGKCERLAELMVKDNLLRFLPSEICSCKSMMILDVSNNRIEGLAHEIGHLTRLEELDISGNGRITAFPTCLWQCRQLKSLKFDDTKITFPPKEINQLGVDTILRWLSEFSKSKAKVIQQKMILVGDANTGKTSMRKRFMGEWIQLTDLMKIFSSAPTTTCGVDIEVFPLDSTNGSGSGSGSGSNSSLPEIKESFVTLWDFSGIDFPNLRYFLTPNALYFIFFNATDPFDVILRSVQNWLSKIRHAVYPHNPEIFLIGSRLADISEAEATILLTKLQQQISQPAQPLSPYSSSSNLQQDSESSSQKERVGPNSMTNSKDDGAEKHEKPSLTTSLKMHPGHQTPHHDEKPSLTQSMKTHPGHQTPHHDDKQHEKSSLTNAQRHGGHHAHHSSGDIDKEKSTLSTSMKSHQSHHSASELERPSSLSRLGHQTPHHDQQNEEKSSSTTQKPSLTQSMKSHHQQQSSSEVERPSASLTTAQRGHGHGHTTPHHQDQNEQSSNKPSLNVSQRGGGAHHQNANSDQQQQPHKAHISAIFLIDSKSQSSTVKMVQNYLKEKKFQVSEIPSGCLWLWNEIKKMRDTVTTEKQALANQQQLHPQLQEPHLLVDLKRLSEKFPQFSERELKKYVEVLSEAGHILYWGDHTPFRRLIVINPSLLSKILHRLVDKKNSSSTIPKATLDLSQMNEIWPIKQFPNISKEKMLWVLERTRVAVDVSAWGLGEFIPEFLSEGRSMSKLENFQIFQTSQGIGRFIDLRNAELPINFVHQLWLEWCEQLSEFNEKFSIWSSQTSIGFVTIFVKDHFTVSTLVEHATQCNQLRVFVFVSGLDSHPQSLTPIHQTSSLPSLPTHLVSHLLPPPMPNASSMPTLMTKDQKEQQSLFLREKEKELLQQQRDRERERDQDSDTASVNTVNTTTTSSMNNLSTLSSENDINNNNNNKEKEEEEELFPTPQQAQDAEPVFSKAQKLRDERLVELLRLVEFLLSFEKDLKYRRRVPCNCSDCISALVAGETSVTTFAVGDEDLIGDSEMVPPLAKTSIKVVVCANKQTKPVKIDSLMPLSVLNVPPTIPNTHSPGHHTSHKTRRPASRTNSGDLPVSALESLQKEAHNHEKGLGGGVGGGGLNDKSIHNYGLHSHDSVVSPPNSVTSPVNDSRNQSTPLPQQQTPSHHVHHHQPGHLGNENHPHHSGGKDQSVAPNEPSLHFKAQLGHFSGGHIWGRNFSSSQSFGTFNSSDLDSTSGDNDSENSSVPPSVLPSLSTNATSTTTTTKETHDSLKFSSGNLKFSPSNVQQQIQSPTDSLPASQTPIPQTPTPHQSSQTPIPTTTTTTTTTTTVAMTPQDPKVFKPKVMSEEELDGLRQKFEANTVISERLMFWKGFCKFFEATFPHLKGRYDIAERIWLTWNRRSIEFGDIITPFSILLKGTFKEKLEFMLHAYDTESSRSLNRSEVLLAMENFNAFFGKGVDDHGKLPEFVYGMFKRLAPDVKAKLSIPDIIAEVLPYLDEQFNLSDSNLSNSNNDNNNNSSNNNNSGNLSNSNAKEEAVTKKK